MKERIPQYSYHEDTINAATLWPITDKHGPGKRMALWTQGCTLNCFGCTNAHMHSAETKYRKCLQEIVDLAQESVRFCDPIEGITLMGGEPMQQAESVLRLLEKIEHQIPNMNAILFTGYKLDILRRVGNPHIDKILNMVDVVIDGRYDHKKRNPDSIAGSTNQIIHHLNQERLQGRDFSRQGQAQMISASSTTTTIQETAFSLQTF